MTSNDLIREPHPFDETCRQCDMPLHLCACDYEDNGDGVKVLWDDLGEAGA